MINFKVIKKGGRVKGEHLITETTSLQCAVDFYVRNLHSPHTLDAPEIILQYFDTGLKIGEYIKYEKDKDVILNVIKEQIKLLNVDEHINPVFKQLSYRLNKRKQFCDFKNKMLPNEPHFYPISLTELITSCYRKVETIYPEFTSETKIELAIDDFIHNINQDKIGYIICTKQEHLLFHEVKESIPRCKINGDYEKFIEEYSKFNKFLLTK